MVDKIGQKVDSVNAARSTVFHAYCETGEWPAGLQHLPERDIEEIQKWKVPMPFVCKFGSEQVTLPYPDSLREVRVALDADFEAVDVPRDVPQSEIATRYPNVMVCGHLDMAWVLKDRDLVIVSDIKSIIFTAKERCDSLQLHGYGLGAAAKFGVSRYLTSIWDASDGRYYVAASPVDLNSFEADEIRDRIRKASEDRDGNFLTGPHCSGCWKRDVCEAHLVNVPESEFKALFDGTATEADIRNALVRKKQLETIRDKVDELCKSWVERHGPVRSEDGRKHWRPEMRTKSSTDYKAVMRDLGVENFDAYKRDGKPHPVFEWRNRE